MNSEETTLEEAWLRELKQKVENMQWRGTQEEWDARIFQVPYNIRSADPEAYDPKVVSLGPYHHRRLHEQDEMLKLLYLNKFIARNEEVDMEDYLILIKESEHRARNAYAGRVDMGSNNFAEMMLLDCCFVLEFLLLLQQEGQQKKRDDRNREVQRQQPSPASDQVYTRSRFTTEDRSAAAAGRGSDEQDPIKIVRKWALPLMLHDLLKLENQLPLFLLRRLFQKASIAGVPPLSELIVNFFKHFSLFPDSKTLTSAENPVTDLSIMNCHHLLHLFHSCIVPTKTPDRGVADVHHRHFSDRPFLIPCARELREARVKFVKKNTKGTFMDIDFHPPSPLDGASFWSSRLEIPEILIDDDTNTLFRNLIAFEQCCPGTKDYVSAYASFMDAVIDTDADVALLRQRRIVVNGLGSDQEVAQLFNQLCKEVTVDLENSYLQTVMTDVNKHCEGRCNKCCASLMHTYFSKPWLLVSVIAGVILFVLTLLQTLYSILSYEKQ